MTRRRTVLIVDDVDAVRRLLRDVLEPEGYGILEAKDGWGALWIAQSHEGPIDLVITDVDMPLLSGPEFAVRLARLGRKSRVLFLSGHGDAFLREFGLRRDAPHLEPIPIGAPVACRAAGRICCVAQPRELPPSSYPRPRALHLRLLAIGPLGPAYGDGLLLPKPFIPSELREKVRSLLSHSPERAERRDPVAF